MPLTSAPSFFVPGAGLFCQIWKKPCCGGPLFQNVGSLRRRLPSKWLAARSRCKICAVARSFSARSPWALRLRNVPSAAWNAPDRMAIMKIIRAIATSSSTSVNPCRRFMIDAPERIFLPHPPTLTLPHQGGGLFSPSPLVGEGWGGGYLSPSPLVGEGWGGGYLSPSPLVGEGWGGGYLSPSP